MKLFNKVPKKLIAALITVAAIAGIGAGVMAGFGPDRPTKQWSTAANGFDHVTFNSFVGVGNGIGDERDFLRGVQVGRDSVWADPVNNVNDTAIVEAKIYIHNNADVSLNDAAGNPGIARNVNVRVAIPTGSAQATDVTSYISADNASPAQIFDTMSLTGANGGFFELEYVPGSAIMSDQSGATTPVSDTLVTTGTNIGDQKGCFQSVREIRFRLKVKMPNYSFSKQVAIVGQGGWTESVNAQPTDTLGWLMTFTNTGNTALNSVRIVDNVPAGLVVVPGTIKMTNGNYPNGTVIPDSAIQANGRQINVDAGNYDPGISTYISFRTTFDMNALACGANSVVNQAESVPQGYGAIRDVATANVTKTCEQVVVKKCTGLTASVSKLFVGEEFTFTAAAEVTNATVGGYNFNAYDASGALVASYGQATNATTGQWMKAFDKAGTYKVTVTVNTDKGLAEGVCETVVTVENVPVTPVYSCNGVTIDVLGGKKVKVAVAVTALPTDKVQVQGYEYVFGDGQKIDQTTNNTVEHTYAQDGTYNVSVKVSFMVNGVLQTVSEGCSKVVTITTPQEKCEFNAALPKGDSKCRPKCQYNANLLDNDPKCVKVTTIPNTGSGSLLGMFIISTMLGVFMYRFNATRRA